MSRHETWLKHMWRRGDIRDVNVSHHIKLTTNKTSIFEYFFLLLFFTSEISECIDDDTKNEVQNDNDDDEEEQ